MSDTPSVVSIVEDRMRRAFEGEDIGPISGLTYGALQPGPTEDEIRMAIARTNYERGRVHERERIIDILTRFSAKLGDKRTKIALNEIIPFLEPR